MRADVNKLARVVAASPEAVAARIDVNGAAAGVSRRVDALGSALVQLRLSLLASLERTGARVNEPPWLAPLQTTLTLSAGDTGSLLGQLARVSTGLEQVLAHLDRDAFATRAPDRPEDLDDSVKFQAVLDMLAGVIRRQDQVATVVTSLLEHLNGPTGVLSAITRMAQRERAVDLRLDRIDAGPDTRSASPESRAVEVARPDDDRVQAAVLRALELQEEAFAGRLDRLDATIRTLADQANAAAPGPGPTLELMLQRLDQQERATARRLEWVGDRLAEVAVHLVTAAEPPEQAPEPTGLGPAVEERLDAVREVVTGLSRHQEALTANLSRLVDQIPPPPDPSASAVGSRLDSVRDALDRLARRQEALTANVARLVVQIPPPPDPSVSANATRRLEELRNERILVQVRLQEERLLAAQSWSDEPPDEDFDDAPPS